VLLPLLYSNFDFRLVDMPLTDGNDPVERTGTMRRHRIALLRGRADSLPAGGTRTTEIIEAIGLHTL
jgi:hypothetical protein